MIKRIPAILLGLSLLLAACTTSAPGEKVTNQKKTDSIVTVFKPPTWGCCGDWTSYMEDNGYSVEVKNVQNLADVKNQYQVPPQLQSCHTAIVDGYVIEGHVPVNEIERLRAEKPDILGLAVPGMPIGSPGMEADGVDNQPYNVISFDEQGNFEIFASYDNWVSFVVLAEGCSTGWFFLLFFCNQRHAINS